MKIDTVFFIGNWASQKAIDAVDGVCFSIVGYIKNFKKKPTQAIKIVYNQNIVPYERLQKKAFNKGNILKKGDFLPADEKYQNFQKNGLF